MTNVGNGYDISIDEENIDIAIIDGQECLVIPCIGTFIADDSTNVSKLDVSITRKLEDPTTANYNFNVYMLTDNENYYRNEVRNVYDEIVKLDGEHPETCYNTSLGFKVNGDGILGAKTNVEYNTITYEIINSNEIVNKGEKEEPILVDSNTSVTYLSKIKAEGTSLTNLTMIAKLPKANNTQIYDSTKSILDSDYELPVEFYENNADKVNGNTQGSPVTQVDMTNFNLVEIYTSRENIKTRVNPSDYTIYYTNDDAADFTTTNFTQYNEGDTLTNAKNIKVVFNKGFRLRYRVYPCNGIHHGHARHSKHGRCNNSSKIHKI